MAGAVGETPYLFNLLRIELPSAIDNISSSALATGPRPDVLYATDPTSWTLADRGAMKSERSDSGHRTQQSVRRALSSHEATPDIKGGAVPPEI
jgi:hypothetical protein